MHINGLAITFTLTVIVQLLLSPGFAHGSAATSQMQTSAIILGKGSCSFVTPGSYAITFAPALNPLSAIDRSASVTFSVKCTGIGSGTSVVVVDRAGANQLYLSKGSDTVPYTLNLPTSASVTNKYSTVNVTLTATVIGNAYKNVPAGDYRDTITINVTP